MVACACDIRVYCISIFLLQAVKGRSHIRCAALIVFLCPAIGGVKRHRPRVCLSVRLSVLGRSCRRRAAGLGYRHVGCLQLSHVRPAGPEDPRTDVDPPRVELPSAGAYRLAAPGAITC